MNRERQRQAEEVFMALVEAEASQRAGVLDERCAGDADLRSEVLSLLEAHEGCGGVLDREAPITIAAMINLGAPAGAVDETEPQGTRIGAYTIIEHLGSGGMGEVYVARQERPSRTVALKLIRRGLMTPSMLRRFEYEAEILGRLRHPGIALIYEAGTAAGPRGPQPFLAMELVRGMPLTRHAAARELTVRDRVALMVRVCDAIQHAHQKGVIHRDLKPANILVESETSLAAPAGAPASVVVADRIGQPKVLDFGVARAVHAIGSVTTIRTNFGQLIGTLPYMSPEQVQGDPKELDTRADVYALGVLLYELLAEKLPHDVSNRPLPEVVRTICEGKPAPLSSIRKVFRGDLDTIVQKAMDKDKLRRYQSAADLGSDLSRYLSGDPIGAKRDSALYVISKQLSRYRHAVIAGLCAAVLVVAFAVHATLQWRSNRNLASDLSKQLVVSRDLSERLQEELSQANIERGRLLTLTGNSPAGELLIWAELLRRPESRSARWALREFYAREPKLRTAPVNAGFSANLAYSPSSSLIAFVGPQRTIEVWDDQLRRRIAAFPAHDDRISALALNPEGTILATADHKGVMRLWEPRKGSLLRELAGADGTVYALAFRPDGTQVCAGGTAKMLAVWDIVRGDVRRLGPLPAAVSDVAYSPDGSLLASTLNNGQVLLWSVASGACERVLETSMQAAGAVAFTRDGESIVVAGAGGDVGMWRLDGWERTATGRTGLTVVSHLSMDHEGRILAVAGRAAIEILNLPDLTPRSVLLRESPASFAVALRPDGRSLYSAASDGAVSMWEIAPGGGQRVLHKLAGWIYAAASSPDGSLLAASGEENIVRVFVAASGELGATLRAGGNGRVRALRFSPDGTLLAMGTAAGDLRLFNVDGWTSWKQAKATRSMISSIAFHPGGRLVAAGDSTGEVSIWGLPAASTADPDVDALGAPASELSLVRRSKVGAGCEAIAYSLDGARLYVGGADPVLSLMNPDSGDVLESVAERNQAIDLALSADGKLLLLVGFLTTAELRDAATLAVRALLTGHVAPITSAAFNPDSSLAATGSSDSTIRIWDAATGLCLMALEGHKGEVSALGFLPDGHRLFSAGADGALRLWDLEYCDRHIAGNLHYHAEQFRARTGESPDISALERWSESVPNGSAIR